MSAKVKDRFRPILAGIIIAGLSVLSGRAQIVNGGFETGDLTGWTSSSGALAAVVSSAQGLAGSPAWSPTEGQYFAYLLAGGGLNVYTLLSQEFAAGAGSELELDVFFDAGDDNVNFNDDGLVELINLATLAAVTLYAQSVSSVPGSGHDGWRTISHTIPEAGTYRLSFGVRNVGDNLFPSAIGIDRITLQDPSVEEGLDATVENWFTDSEGNPLPTNADGHDLVDVVTRTDRAGTVLIVASTPGQLMAWVNVAPTLGPVNSLALTALIPEGWNVHPSWNPAAGGIHLHYFNGTDLVKIIAPALISAEPAPLGTVELTVPSLPDLIGKELAPGESLLLGIKIGLARQPAGAFPRTNPSAASATVYSEENFTGASGAATGTAILLEKLKK